MTLARPAQTYTCWGFQGPGPKPTPPSDHTQLGGVVLLVSERRSARWRFRTFTDLNVRIVNMRQHLGLHLRIIVLALLRHFFLMALKLLTRWRISSRSEVGQTIGVMG